MILGSQEAPVEISGLANSNTGPVLGYHMHTAGRVDLHQGVGDEDDMHAVDDTGDHGVPQPGPTEVPDTDHDLPFFDTAGL